MKLNNRIGRFIRKERKKKGLTIKELAKLILVSQQQMSRYEIGVTSLSLENILIILSILNVPIDDFFDEIIRPEQNKLFFLILDELKKDGVINGSYL